MGRTEEVGASQATLQLAGAGDGRDRWGEEAEGEQAERFIGDHFESFVFLMWYTWPRRSSKLLSTVAVEWASSENALHQSNALHHDCCGAFSEDESTPSGHAPS